MLTHSGQSHHVLANSSDRYFAQATWPSLHSWAHKLHCIPTSKKADLDNSERIPLQDFCQSNSNFAALPSVRLMHDFCLEEVCPPDSQVKLIKGRVEDLSYRRETGMSSSSHWQQVKEQTCEFGGLLRDLWSAQCLSGNLEYFRNGFSYPRLLHKLNRSITADGPLTQRLQCRLQALIGERRDHRGHSCGVLRAGSKATAPRLGFKIRAIL